MLYLLIFVSSLFVDHQLVCLLLTAIDWHSYTFVHLLLDPLFRGSCAQHVIWVVYTGHVLSWAARRIVTGEWGIAFQIIYIQPEPDLSCLSPCPPPSPHGFEQASLRLLDRLSCDALKRGLHQHRHHSQRHSRCSHPSDGRRSREEQRYWVQQQIWLVTISVASPSIFTIILAVLNTPDVNAHLFLAADIFPKEASVSEVSKRIASTVAESLSKQ